VVLQQNKAELIGLYAIAQSWAEIQMQTSC